MNWHRFLPKKKQEPTVSDVETGGYFISSDRDFLQGQEAQEQLKQKNDWHYFQEEAGILCVDKERWQEAQSFESRTWLCDNRQARLDNNLLHQANFDDYFHLQDRTFQRGIELGCGPFTNIRHIAKFATIAEIHLLDPLLKQYTKHPHCVYQGGTLKIPAGLFTKKKKAFLHNIPIEELQTDLTFDLVILINVLEHCYDAERIFGQILKIISRGGYFVFYDKYLEPDFLAQKVKTSYDAGHPLRISGRVIDRFLEDNFYPLLYKLNYFPVLKRGMNVSYHGLYFIGWKK